MNKVKVLVAHNGADFCHGLQNALQEDCLIKVCTNGVCAQEALQLFCPDIFVLDMLLPGIDGITLLQRATEMGCRPAVIAVTDYCSDYILETAERMGVSYLMRKPSSPEACAQRIEDMAQNLRSASVPKTDPRTQVSNLLLQFGFSAKLKGYAFLRESILLFSEDPEQAVTKELYPSVAQMFHSTGQRVERAIRGAIQSAWENGSRQLWRSFFADAEGAFQCPTNSEFIACVTDRLILEKERTF